jgi:hypothetical protein
MEGKKNKSIFTLLVCFEIFHQNVSSKSSLFHHIFGKSGFLISFKEISYHISYHGNLSKLRERFFFSQGLIDNDFLSSETNQKLFVKDHVKEISICIFHLFS